MQGGGGANPSLLYGLVSTMSVLIAGRHGECTVNPARTLGLAIVFGRWKHPIWIHWIGCVTGGIVAGGVYQLMHWNTTGGQVEEVESPVTTDDVFSFSGTTGDGSSHRHLVVTSPPPQHKDI